MKKELATQLAYAFGGAAVGGLTTYLVINSRLKAKYEQIANEEIASIKDHYNEKLEEGIEDAKETYAFVKGTPEEATRIYLKRIDEVQAMANYGQQIEELGYGDSPLGQDIVTTPAPDSEELMVVEDEPPMNPDDKRKKDAEEALELLREKLRNGVPEEESDDDGDYDVSYRENFNNIEEELKDGMISEDPYVIPIAEFFQDKEEYQKLTITYYEKDDTLVDERQSPIPDVEGTVGKNFAEQFGDRSDDANIVYIRNNRLDCDFEVVRDSGSYISTVLGYDDESAKKKSNKRMREDG